MTYQEFKKNIILAITERLGSAYQVALQDIIKNNDTHLDGLTILSENSNVSPTIYLNYYYEQYTNGKAFSAVCEDILHSYYHNVPKQKIDIRFFTNYENVKHRIVYKLVSSSRNKELLKQVPHILFLDMALIFNCFIDFPSECSGATILIYNHHLDFWHISAEELYVLALQNTPKLLPYQVQNMSDIVSDFLDSDTADDFRDTFTQTPMYILSNNTKLNGAGCILYEHLMEDLSNRLRSDFYILPCSIHEVLLIPVEHISSFEELTSTVCEVNTTQLTPEEILSDHVYHYSRNTGKITIANC